MLLKTSLLGMLTLSALSAAAKPGAPGAAPPVDDPAARYGLAWTGALPWDRVVVVTNFAGASWDERFAAAQRAVAEQGGGVVYFPAGDYAFTNTLYLESHVIVRGAAPDQRGVRGETIHGARDLEYRVPTRFMFPRYVFSTNGTGTARDSAFKGIELRDPDRTTHCGVVNVALMHGHVHFGCDVYEAQRFIDGFATYGRNHIVYGCRITNAAILDPRLPRDWQKPWQRWTHRHRAAIDIRAAANVLVANNQIPESTDADFMMAGYRIRTGNQREPWREDAGEQQLGYGTRDDIAFRYDNRPGIYVNYGAVEGTPESHPHAFAPGIDIRENYVFCYGCLAIGFSGDGTHCGLNTIRYPPDAYLPIFDGETDSHFTNNNRAIEARGWRWTIVGNDYEVYSNLQFNPGQFGGHYGDCEGIMHEAHNNVSIKDSRLLYNVGNRYLCLWRVPVDGLEIRGNIIRVPSLDRGGKPAICVQGQKHRSTEMYEIRNCRIEDNACEGGIRLHGIDAGGNVVRNNRNLGPEPTLFERSVENVTREANENYQETDRISYR